MDRETKTIKTIAYSEVASVSGSTSKGAGRSTGTKVLIGVIGLGAAAGLAVAIIKAPKDKYGAGCGNGLNGCH
jgi:hypothetical protein